MPILSSFTISLAINYTGRAKKTAQKEKVLSTVVIGFFLNDQYKDAKSFIELSLKMLKIFSLENVHKHKY